MKSKSAIADVFEPIDKVLGALRERCLRLAMGGWRVSETGRQELRAPPARRHSECMGKSRKAKQFQWLSIVRKSGRWGNINEVAPNYFEDGWIVGSFASLCATY